MKDNGIKRDHLNAKGQIGLAVVFFFVFGLALGSLALDAGQLYYQHSRLQKILDNAALDGVNMALKGKPQNDVRQFAERVVKSQAIMQHIAIKSGSLHATVQLPNASSQSTRVDIRAQVCSNTLLYRFLEVVAGHRANTREMCQDVTAAAATRRRPVMLSIVLGYDGAMPSWLPNTPEILMGEQPFGFEKMRDAVLALLDTLTYSQDQIAIISYDAEATVNVPMMPVNGSSEHPKDNRTYIKQQISLLSAGGQANLAEAVWMGNQQISDPTIGEGDIRRIMILISNGQPSIIHTYFPYPKRANENRGAQVFNPNLKHFLQSNWTLRSTLLDRRSYWDAELTPLDCQRNGPFSDGYTMKAFEKCLEQPIYKDSKGLEMRDINSSNSLENQAFHALTDLTIRESDYTKDRISDPNKRITIYTVGLGNAPAMQTDPYMCVANSAHSNQGASNPVLLRKIANDSAANNDPRFHSDNSNYNPGQAKGRYLPIQFVPKDPLRDNPIRDALIDIINEDFERNAPTVIQLIDPATD
jgi:hypothetical protein